MAARALRRSRHFSSYAALSAGVLAFSTSGALTKLTSAPSVTIAFWVRVFSLAYLVAMFLFHNRRRRGDLLAGAWPHGLAAGLIFGVHILLYFWALKLTSVTVVFLLGALNPAVVGVFGWLFLNERLRPSQAFWTAMAIVAAIFVVVQRDASGGLPLFGNLVALVASLGYCAYFLVSRHARRSIGTTEFLVVATVVSMAVAGAAGFVGGVSLGMEPRDFWIAALLGLIPGTIGHLTVSWALRHVEAHAASTVLLAVPMFASLWAYLLVGERIALGQIVAGAVVLLAIPGAIRRPDVPPTFEPIPQPLDGTVDRAVT